MNANAIALATLGMDEEAAARYAIAAVWGEAAVAPVMVAAQKAAEESASGWAQNLANDGCKDDAETIVERARQTADDYGDWDLGAIEDIAAEALGRPLDANGEEGEAIDAALDALRDYVIEAECAAFQ